MLKLRCSLIFVYSFTAAEAVLGMRPPLWGGEKREEVRSKSEKVLPKTAFDFSKPIHYYLLPITLSQRLRGFYEL